MRLRSATRRYWINANDDPARRELERAAAAGVGSNAAIEERPSRYPRRRYRRPGSTSRDHEDAEAASRKTSLRAYLALDSIEGRAHFASWQTRIAMNSALMVLRKRRTRIENSLEPSSESRGPALTVDARDTALNPERRYDLRRRSYCASRTIERLNIGLRAFRMIRIEQECSMNEAARTPARSEAKVTGRLRPARKQLRCSKGFKERTSKRGLISGSKRQSVTAFCRNRELPCPSCD